MLSTRMQREWLRSFLLGTMEKCDRGTWEHSIRVGKLCERIASEFGYSKKEVSYITLAGLLHDVGKVFMTDMINYPGRLPDRDMYIVSQHPQLGIRFININFSDVPAQVTEGIVLHHERLNGSGYPYNLKGDEISMAARIVAVADVFDAMSNLRPYRPPLPKSEVYKELCRPGYDQDAVFALMKNLRND